MYSCVVISVFCFTALVSAFPMPMPQNGMVYFHMPYYNPYQTMYMHYMPQGRTASTSAFASGDAIAAGTIVRENRVQSDENRAYNQEDASSSDDGNVEAIAEAFPEEPVQGTVQFDQSDEQYNEVIPLNAAPSPSPSPAPVSVEPKEIIEPEQKITASEQPQLAPTPAPKKKVHIALDIPDKNDEIESDDDDEDAAYGPQKPSRKNSAPTYTYFPISFGRATGGTIAIANAMSTGKGAVRSHAIAYGSNGSSRRHPAAERQRNVSAAQKTA